MSKPAETPDRPVRRRAPAMSFEEREDQLVCLAMDLAEEQIRSKTASSQVITEFLLRSSLKRLRILISTTCVGLRYGLVKLELSGFSWDDIQ